MKKAIADFPRHLIKGYQIGEEKAQKISKNYTRWLIAGMGGSGIASRIALGWLQSGFERPIHFLQDYTLPLWANSGTLLIITSYSGNTEEMLSLWHQANEKGVPMVVISSGGKLLHWAMDREILFFQLPEGFAPRAALGYGLGIWSAIIDTLAGKNHLRSQLSAFEHLCAENSQLIEHYASQIAGALKGSIPVIFSDSNMEWVGLRFRQQLNENAKMMAWQSIIPEMCHNELVAWPYASTNLRPVILHHSEIHPKNANRIAFLKETMRQKNIRFVEIMPQGSEAILQELYTIHLTDWISWYLSQLNNVDINDIKILEELKERMSAL